MFLGELEYILFSTDQQNNATSKEVWNRDVYVVWQWTILFLPCKTAGLEKPFYVQYFQNILTQDKNISRKDNSTHVKNI